MVKVGLPNLHSYLPGCPRRVILILVQSMSSQLMVAGPFVELEFSSSNQGGEAPSNTIKRWDFTHVRSSLGPMYLLKDETTIQLARHQVPLPGSLTPGSLNPETPVVTDPRWARSESSTPKRASSRCGFAESKHQKPGEVVAPKNTKCKNQVRVATKNTWCSEPS